MRIAILAGAGYVSGKEIVSLMLLNELRARGHEVFAVIPTWNNGDMPARLEAEAIPFAQLPLGFISTSLKFRNIRMTTAQVTQLPKLWSQYRRLLKTFRPHAVIHSTLNHLVVLRPFLRRQRDFFHVHDAFPETTIYRWLLRSLSQRLKGYIAVSSFIGRHLIELGVSSALVHVVLNGVEVSDIGLQATGCNELRLGNGGTITLAIVGQVTPWKGHEDLIEALSLLHTRGISRFRCLIYGATEGDFVQQLRDRIREKGLVDHVSWMGYVRDIRDIYREVDVVVVPSRTNDPMPLAVLEALARGIPVVGSRRGGIVEAILDGETGLLANAEDPTDLSSKLERVVVDDELRIRMGRAAHQQAATTFSANRMAAEVEQILAGQLSSAPA